MSKKPLGIILYQGPSNIDGKQIIVIANTLNKSKNGKISNMIQCWILRADIPPILAQKLGMDFSICSDCRHRHFNSCYVDLSRGPEQIYDAFHRRRYVYYEPYMLEYFRDKYIRLGAYGDPAVAPIEVWDTICKVAKGHNGYSHQWKKCNQKLRHYCMASVDNIKEYYQARDLGWRTFRTRLENDIILEDEFICPASKEGGRKSNCNKCKACNGSSFMVKCPTIIAHGGGIMEWRAHNFEEGIKRLKNKKKWKRDYSEVLIKQ